MIKISFSNPKALSRYPEGFKDFWLISSEDVTSTPVDLCAFCNQMHFWHRFQKCHFSNDDCSLFEDKLNMIQVYFIRQIEGVFENLKLNKLSLSQIVPEQKAVPWK